VNRSCQQLSPDLPFGGVNIIFAGDLGQLRPVVGSALYAYNLVSKLAPKTTDSVLGQHGLFGAHLWRQVPHVVELKENQRARTDPDFIEFLNRVRVGEASIHKPEGGSDYQFLQSRLLDHLQISKPDEFEDLKDAPVVFGERRLRDLYNEKKAHEFTSLMGQEYRLICTIMTAVDTSDSLVSTLLTSFATSTYAQVASLLPSTSLYRTRFKTPSDPLTTFLPIARFSVIIIDIPDNNGIFPSASFDWRRREEVGQDGWPGGTGY
jgi:hypothetical protein